MKLAGTWRLLLSSRPWFVEFLDDQHPVDEVLDDVVLQGLELLVEFLLVAGLRCSCGNQRADLPADVVHRDDLVLDDGGYAVGEAQVEAVAGRGGCRRRGHGLLLGGKEGSGREE